MEVVGQDAGIVHVTWSPIEETSNKYPLIRAIDFRKGIDNRQLKKLTTNTLIISVNQF